MRRLVPAVVVAVVIAGCTARPATSAQAPPPTPASANAAPSHSSLPSDVAALLARPMRLPSITAGAACPVSPVTARSPVSQPADAHGLGTGPLYPITFYIGEDATLRLGRQTPASDGLYELKVVWAAKGGYEGPVVVRAGRVDGHGRAFVRLSYQPQASHGDAVVIDLTGSPTDFPSSTSVSGAGCYAYQVDGPDLAEVMVFRVVA